MGEISDISLRPGSSTRRRNADAEPIGDRILHTSTGCFVAGHLTSLPTIQSLMRRCLPEYHSSEVPGLEEPPEAPAVGNFDTYAADGKIRSDWYLSNFTADLDLGHRSSIRAD